LSTTETLTQKNNTLVETILNYTAAL